MLGLAHGYMPHDNLVLVVVNSSNYSPWLASYTAIYHCWYKLQILSNFPFFICKHYFSGILCL